MQMIQQIALRALLSVLLLCAMLRIAYAQPEITGQPPVDTPQTLPQVLQLLHSDKKVDRDKAKGRLAQINETWVVAPMIDALQDNDPNVCLAVLKILKQKSHGFFTDTEQHRMAARLLPLMTATNREVCKQAADLLQFYPLDETATPALIAMALDSKSDIRIKAISILGSLRDKRAFEPLRQLITDKDATLHGPAILALGMIDDPRVIEIPEPVMTGPDARLREVAAWALDRSKEPRAVDLLLRALADPVPAVRLAALQSLDFPLKRQRNPRVLEAALALCRQNDDVEVRMQAFYFLRYTRDPRVWQALLDAMQEKALKARVLPVLVDNIPIADGKPDPRVIEVFLAALQDRDAGVRDEAAGCAEFRAFKDPRVIGQLNRYLQRYEPSQSEAAPPSIISVFTQPHLLEQLGCLVNSWGASRPDPPPSISPYLVIRALGVQGGAESVETVLDFWAKNGDDSHDCENALQQICQFDATPLLHALDNPDRYRRANAAMVLAHLGNPRAIGPLLELLGEKDYVLRMSAIDALLPFADRAEVIDALLPLAQDADAETRRAVVIVLGRAHGTKVTPILLAALHDASADVRIAAAGSLSESEDPAVLPALIPLVTGRDIDLRVPALCSVIRIGGKDANDVLTRLQHSPQSTLRELAVKCLPGKDEAFSRGLLLTALRDPDPVVRKYGALGLATLGDVAINGVLLELLQSHDEFDVYDGINRLTSLGDSRAVDPMAKLLSSTNLSLADQDARALGKIGDPRAVDPLLRALKERRGTSMTRSCIEALAMLHDPRAVESLAEIACADRRNSDRREAVKALVAIGGKTAEPHLRLLLDDEDDEIRLGAASALARKGDMQAQRVILDALQDGAYPWGRTAAVVAAGDLRLPGAYNRLLEILVRENAGINELSLHESLSAVVVALGHYKDPRATMPLIALLHSASEPDLQLNIVDALAEICDFRAIEALRLLKDIVNYNGLSTHVYTALVKLRDPQLTAEMLDELQTKQPDTRKLHGTALLSLRDPRAVPSFIKLLSGDSLYLRASAAETLGNIGDRLAVKPLIAACKDYSSNVRLPAARALGQLGDPAAIPALLPLLHDPIYRIRAAAAVALKSITHEDFGPDPAKWQAWQANKGKPMGKSTHK